MDPIQSAGHWEKIYSRREVETLGWYEDNPEPSLSLIMKCRLPLNAGILNVGTGASTLVDTLLQKGYHNIIANDISQHALRKLKARLGPDAGKLQWIAEDLLHPKTLKELPAIDLWHDRAVLHFFIDEKDQDAYFKLLKKLVKPGGYVVIAAFNLDGATRCSNLPVKRYNETMISGKLGNDFHLLEAFDYIYTMPSGDIRPYVYTLYRRIK